MANAILGLLAETSLHAGASASSGVIDLPIQREAHTGWPCVFGSGVKGALRTAADDKVARDNRAQAAATPATEESGAEAPALETSWVDEVFGPSVSNATSGNSSYAGALNVGDARLLLLPVRSLTGHFKWVTCPALLNRAIADCHRLGIAVSEDVQTAIENLSVEDVIVTHQAAPQNANQNIAPDQQSSTAKIFLEELSFTKSGCDLSLIIGFLAQFMDVANAPKLLRSQLAIVSDDIIAHLAQFATPVTAHIAIDNKHKRVKDGALWYEETLPPETLLYVVLQAQSSRRNRSEKTAQQVLDHIQVELLGSKPYLQLGGNETVGMGWCKATFLSAPMEDN